MLTDYFAQYAGREHIKKIYRESQMWLFIKEPFFLLALIQGHSKFKYFIAQNVFSRLDTRSRMIEDLIYKLSFRRLLLILY